MAVTLPPPPILVLMVLLLVLVPSLQLASLHVLVLLLQVLEHLHALVPATVPQRRRDVWQALAVLQSDSGVDLLFTDVMMPGGLDGVALAEAGRRARPDLKVLLTSGYSETLLRERGRLHDLPILAKPYHRDELVQRLQDLLGRADTDV